MYPISLCNCLFCVYSDGAVSRLAALKRLGLDGILQHPDVMAVTSLKGYKWSPVALLRVVQFLERWDQSAAIMFNIPTSSHPENALLIMKHRTGVPMFQWKIMKKDKAMKAMGYEYSRMHVTDKGVQCIFGGGSSEGIMRFCTEHPEIPDEPRGKSFYPEVFVIQREESSWCVEGDQLIKVEPRRGTGPVWTQPRGLCREDLELNEIALQRT